MDVFTLAFFIECFTNPVMAIRRLTHRRAKLLSWVLLFAIAFTIVVLFILLVFNPHHETAIRRYALLLSGLFVSLLFAYTLNCAGYYYASAASFVITAAIAPWISLLFDPSIFQGDFVPLAYITISTVLSSILLPIHITIVLAVLQFIGVSLVLYFSPASASFNWISFLAYVFLISVLSILKNTIIQRDVRRITDQAGQLAVQKALFQEQAIHDELTNLFNRRYFEETLKHEVQRGINENISFGIIIMDVDHFKHINDTLGHVTGDVVIQGVGNFLASHVREADVACRYGGDEFIVVLPNTAQETTKERAEQLRDGIRKLNLPVHITISLGIAVFPENGVDGESLLRSADKALYRAKQNGGDCVYVT